MQPLTYRNFKIIKTVILNKENETCKQRLLILKSAGAAHSHSKYISLY